MKLTELPMFCLNLDRRPDRKLRAWGQFRRQRMKVDRLTACDAVGIQDPRGWQHRGARACAASHLLAWRAARRSGAEGVIVFEDDVILCPDFVERLSRLDVPDDWDVVYFGCLFGFPRPELMGGELLRVNGPTWDNHAYAIRSTLWREASAAIRLRSQRRGWPKRPAPQAHDMVLAEFHPRCCAYAVWLPMAWQVEGLSSNDGTVRGNYDRDGRQRYRIEAISHLPWPEPSATAEAGTATECKGHPFENLAASQCEHAWGCQTATGAP